MKRPILILALLFAITSSCDSSSNTTSNNQNPHAAPHQEMHDKLAQDEIKKSEKENMTPALETETRIMKSDHPKADFYTKKWSDGVLFYAVGNEPSWSLNINKKNTATFNSMNGQEFTASFVAKLPSIDPKSTGYRLSNDKGEMIITLVEDKCMDTMADEEFSFSVAIDLKLKGEKSFTTFKGCGDYVPDPRLHGKWLIVKADTLTINKDQFPNKQPEMNIDIYQGKVSGNDGCNLFNGGMQFRENEIIFGLMAGTMMACPNMDVSTVITRSFIDKKLGYKFENQLIFFEGDKEIMILKREDK